MRRLLKCEFLKTRRRYILLTTLAMTAMLCVWIAPERYSEDMLRVGWMNYLYQLPLANTIFMSLLGMVVSSRFCDIEHRGNMLRVLATVTERGHLYDAKLLAGLAHMTLSVLLSFGATILLGRAAGFAGDVPVRLYLLYLLFTLTPTAAIYMLQHALALCFPNQAVAFFVGIIGTFGGVFSLFLQQFPWLRRILVWGYYGGLQFVGMFGYTPETRYQKVWFDVMEIDWTGFAALCGLSVVLYLAGRAFFVRKEL